MNTEVKRLFEEGQVAAGFAQWEKARTAFGKAFALRPLPQIALNLGRAEVKVGDALSGAEHLQYFLREEPNPDPAEVAAAQALIKEAKPKIVTVTMKVEPADAEVLVDGRPIEKQLLPGPIFLPPGTHSFEAKKDGFQGASQSLELSAGAEVGVPLKLGAVGGGGGLVGDPVDPGKKSPPPKDKTWMYVGAGVSGGLLLLGIGTAIGGKVAQDQAFDAARNVGCSGDQECKPLYEQRASMVEGLAYTSLISFIGAGAVGTVTLIHALSGKKQTADTKEASMASFVVVPTVGGIVVQGTW
ncbi:hypothetical protein [Polyangium spumosum]|uniref:PEGA domain-containing protein n=1 Tax=Polyangium spumosum TaxID=889282 RepID=A0A6N7Q2X7_9BACT|nr:hypothetical protein [Polyangium spumosum]MRG98047.1 hypothetical protein [Polyangium spumosum]